HWQRPTPAHQSRLVLIVDQGQNGASNRPDDTADAQRHGDTTPTSGQREAAATTAPSTAATASANAVLVTAGGIGSTPVSTNSTVNHDRTTSARSANRR